LKQQTSGAEFVFTVSMADAAGQQDDLLVCGGCAQGRQRANKNEPAEKSHNWIDRESRQSPLTKL
jgi:hypothetical protein